MHQERNSSLPSRHHPPISSNPEGKFLKAAVILDSAECFGGALWAAQLEQAAQAKQKIAAAPDDQKHSAFQDCMHSLREAMAAPIEQWAPKYVKLAAAYPQFSKCKPTDWARIRMRSVLGRRLRSADRDGAIAFCLITMSGEDIEHKGQWLAPNWMYQAPQEYCHLQDDPTAFIVRQEHGRLVRRLDYALQRTLARLEVDEAIDAGQVTTTGTRSDGNEESAPESRQLRIQQIFPGRWPDVVLKRKIALRYVNQEQWPTQAEMVEFIQSLPESDRPMPETWRELGLQDWDDAWEKRPGLVRRYLSGITGELRMHGYNVGAGRPRKRKPPVKLPRITELPLLTSQTSHLCGSALR